MSGTAAPASASTAALVFRFGQAIGDPMLSAMGSSGASEDDARPRRPVDRPDAVRACSGGTRSRPGARAPPPLPRDVWLAARGHAADGRARSRGERRRPLRRGLGIAQRPEPQPQRRRQRDRLRRRRARPGRRRAADLHGADVQQPAVRDLGHAVGLPQPPDGERRHAGGRPRVPREGRRLQGDGRGGRAVDGHRAGVPGRRGHHVVAPDGAADPRPRRRRWKTPSRWRGRPPTWRSA